MSARLAQNAVQENIYKKEKNLQQQQPKTQYIYENSAIKYK